jgi:hypothetical protein
MNSLLRIKDITQDRLTSLINKKLRDRSVLQYHYLISWDSKMIMIRLCVASNTH